MLKLQLLTVDEQAMSGREARGVDFLIETDSRIVDQVRKDLSQAYLNIMSRALNAGRLAAQGEAVSQAAIPNSPEK